MPEPGLYESATKGDSRRETGAEDEHLGRIGKSEPRRNEV